MQGRLTIEDDIVVVPQVTLHLVAGLQMCIRAILKCRDVKHLSIRSVNVLSTRPCVGSIMHKPPHFINILSGDCLRHSEIEGDSVRHTELVELKNGIGGDDRTTREVDTLAHEVSSQTTFLTSQSRSYGLQRFAGLVLVSRLTLNFIVHQSGDVVLKFHSDISLS